MDDRTSRAIKIFREHLNKIVELRKDYPNSASHMRWLINVDFDLSRTFGTGLGMHNNWKKIRWQFYGRINIPYNRDPDQFVEQLNLEAYQRGLDMAQGILQSAIDQLKQVGIEVIKEKGYDVPDSDRRIFISHGKQTLALDKIERFVRSIGFNPIVVSREAST